MCLCAVVWSKRWWKWKCNWIQEISDLGSIQSDAFLGWIHHSNTHRSGKTKDTRAWIQAWIPSACWAISSCSSSTWMRQHLPECMCASVCMCVMRQRAGGCMGTGGGLPVKHGAVLPHSSKIISWKRNKVLNLWAAGLKLQEGEKQVRKASTRSSLSRDKVWWRHFSKRETKLKKKSKLD